MKKKTHKEFISEVKRLVGDSIQVCSFYKNDKEKMVFRCTKCGKHFFMSPNKFLSGHRCPNCNPTRRKTFLEMSNRIEKETPEYELLGGYRGTNKDAIFVCKKCNKVFTAKPSAILNKKKICPNCKIRKSINKKSFQDILKENGFISLDEFKGTKPKYRLVHEHCNSILNIKIEDAIREDFSCPYCEEEAAERSIKNFLLNEYLIISGPVNINSYSLNCFISDRKLLIRFMGRKHYENIFNKEFLEDIRKEDEEIRLVCKLNSIKLLEIPFWEKDKLREILKVIGEKVTPKTSYTNFEKIRRELKISSYTKFKSKENIS